MFEVVFLICLGVIWIIAAVAHDFKTYEVPNWLSLSLIVFALGFRFFYGLFGSEINFSFFYQGLIGLGIFTILGTLFYYSRIFAGGDAKLMMALGAVIPFYSNFQDNFYLFLKFLLLFLISGAIYGLVMAVSIGVRNRKLFRKEFGKQFKKNKKKLLVFMIFGIVFLVSSFFVFEFLVLSIGLFVFPYLYIAAKSIDESCMIKKVPPEKLTEGDLLYKDVKIGNKKIKATWGGLSKEEISLLKKNKKEILIRYGIPYTPAFLIGFILLVVFWFKGLDFFGGF